MRKFVAVFLVGLVAGCANSVSPVAVPQNTKSVAIVTSLPKTFSMITDGVTVFDNGGDAVDITGWGLDDLVYTTAASVLSRRYSVSRASADLVLNDYQVPIEKIFEKTDKGIGSIVRDHVHSAAPVDMYVVFYQSLDAERDLERPRDMQGFGITKMHLMFGSYSPFLHTFLMMGVVDARTYKVIARIPIGRDPANDVNGFAEEQLRGFDWKDNWAELDAAQQQLLEDHTKALLTDCVTYTVQGALAR